MENASKALIIAGAILISILLISVGVLIMNSTGGVTSGMESSAKAMEMQSFNSQFTTYIGEKSVSGTQVRSLISNVIASNANNEDHIIEMKGLGKSSFTSSSTDLGEMSKKVKSSKKYTVTMDNDDDGFVKQITIE